MVDKKLVFWLAETNASSSEHSSNSSWSDVCKEKLESSEEDTSEDDDRLFFPLMQYLIRLKRKRVDDYLHIVDSWSDTEFKTRLGLSRKTAERLIDDLQKSGFIATHKFGLKPLEPKLCFYIFLSFLTTTEPLTPIATRFDISISSTFRVVRRVVAWVLTKLNDIIKWPQTFDEVSSICNLFEVKTGVSNIIGVIDCLHVRIEKPKNAREYCNTKGYFSIVLQTTIDANMRFTNVYCGEPGSTSSVRVLKKSPLYTTASQDSNVLFPHHTLLIGHSGYPSLPWLLPPFRENKRLSAQQRDFNSMHLNVRKISEKTFKALRVRFKRVKFFTVYRNTSFITDCVVAACILHNYCINENDLVNENAERR